MGHAATASAVRVCVPHIGPVPYVYEHLLPTSASRMAGTLIGAALADGAIGGLDDPVLRYVPELKGSAYRDNTIRQATATCGGPSRPVSPARAAVSRPS